MIQKFAYDHTEDVAVADLQVGDVMFRPEHPLRPARAGQPYRVTQKFTLPPHGRIEVWAQSVYAARGVQPFAFGRYAPTETLRRAVLEP